MSDLRPVAQLAKPTRFATDRTSPSEVSFYGCELSELRKAEIQLPRKPSATTTFVRPPDALS
jgi:hypothetical protein